MYLHSPASGLESGTASITDFYRPDEVKYHGKGNRGVVTMNFFGKKTHQFLMTILDILWHRSGNLERHFFERRKKIDQNKN